ncbi:hypothetical protein GGQ88_002285 [Novosphingobium hassiacum]|uniref:Uncharacterized protein n=1 Tax=Novosphingobium hassiacum TaxID=173676 RepID=A0A7W5ZXM6_9SPHN|nr:hypothetical protein [Novosphingobium hassiacum]MBB3861013.1 hypothetical protein [Novosphingobium hassiacum]
MGRINPEVAYRPSSTGFNVAAICDCLYAIKGYVATKEAQQLAEVLLNPVPPTTSISAGCSDWRRRTGVKTSKPPVREQNGITMPRPGKCLDVWLAADELRREMGNNYKAISSRIQLESVQRGFNVGNVRTEMSRWKRFHSLA